MQRIIAAIKFLGPLIDPFKPALGRILFMMIGIVLGILFVWGGGLGAVDVEFNPNAEPVQLAEGWREEWVTNSAITYAASIDTGILTEEEQNALRATTKTNLESAGFGPSEVEALAARNEGTLEGAALLTVQDIPSQSAADEANASIEPEGAISGTVNFLGFVLLVTVIFVLLGVALSFRPIPVGKWRKGPVARSEATGALSEKERDRRSALKAAQDMVVEVDEALGEPERTHVTAYVLGDDLYEDSVAIEPDGGFAGEVGVEISETIGVGDPKKVTAFEVFVFDQNDIQTSTVVLMSEHAFHDEALRSKLAARGEPILAQPDAVFMIETKNLKTQVRILTMEYGEGSLPPNSFFSKVTFSLSTWLNEGVEVAGTGSRFQLPSMDDDFSMPPQQMPPQQMPPQQMPQQQMPPQQMPPQQMPPQQMPPQQMPPQQRPPQQMPPQQMPPQQGGYAPPPQQQAPPPQQPRPLTSNAPQPGQFAPQPGQMPQQGTPQQRPLTANQPGQFQQPPPQQQQGGPRPLTSNQPQQRPLTSNQPQQRPPSDDDPFGDTTRM